MLTEVVVFPVPPLWLKIARRRGPKVFRAGADSLAGGGAAMAGRAGSGAAAGTAAPPGALSGVPAEMSTRGAGDVRFAAVALDRLGPIDAAVGATLDIGLGRTPPDAPIWTFCAPAWTF